MQYSKSDLQKIRWRCARRGMMEMDEILTKFFDEHFLELSDVEQQIFFIILDQSDTVLWDWFFTDKLPDKPEIRQLLRKIKV